MKQHKFMVPLLIMTLVIFTGCELKKQEDKPQAQNSTSDDKAQTKIELANRQLEIAKKLAPVERIGSLSTATEFLTDFYPQLFWQKDEEALFETYASITWHTSEESKKAFKTKIEKQPDFKLLKNLYKEKVLPLSENDPYPTFRNIKMDITYQHGEKQSEGSYRINTVYELYKDKQTAQIPVTLLIPENNEFFSELFANADEREQVDYGIPSEKLDQIQKEIMQLLVGNRARLLTTEENKILLESIK
ncbi:hypothetical protein [Paenibacillus sp. GbtcB18]|uniref:hypothetical protein n=1 Tax=Paenibacillus sp. GbtcB18 TaxID=2824763 RepID=UPI001C30AA9D|nr:hypothetical protein [Paenibacillus sp. GbtcB18]